MCADHKTKNQVHAANRRLEFKKGNASLKHAPENDPLAVLISDRTVPVQLSEPFFRWTSDNAQARVQQLNMTDNVILVALLNACERSVTANRTKDFYADQLTDCGALAYDNSRLEAAQACLFSRQRQAVAAQDQLQSQYHHTMLQIKLRMDEDANDLAAAAYAANICGYVADDGHAACASHEQMQDIATFVAAAEDQGIPVLQSTVAVVDGGLLNRSQELEAEVEGLWATIVPPSAVEQVEKLMDEFRQHKLSLNGSVGDGTTFQ